MNLRAGDLVRIITGGCLSEELLLVTAAPRMAVHVDDKQNSQEVLVAEILGKSGLRSVPVTKLQRVKKGKRN